MFCLFILLANIVLILGSCQNGQIVSFSDPTICYSFEKTNMNWFSAMESCTEKGGNLVSIHDMFENMFISGGAASIFTDSTNVDFWIGAIYNSLSPGKWSWIDKSSFDFMDWDKGQPQNTTDSICASVNMNGAKWQANDCFVEKPFVCEIQQTSSSSTTPTTTTTTKQITTTTTIKEPNQCPETWTYFNVTNFCYKAFQTSTTWYDAELNCVNQGGHLTSIHSIDENIFIAYISNKIGSNTCSMANQAWIGIVYNGKDFQWTDGTSFDYSSWVKGAPVEGQNLCTVTWIGQRCSGGSWDIGPTEWDNYNLPCGSKVLNSVCKRTTN